MKKIFFIFFICLNSAYSLERKSSGEYVVTTTNMSAEAVKSALKVMPPDEVKSLGHGQYYLKYKNDPGLDHLQKAAGKTFKIQSNLPYKALPKTRLK